MTQFPALALIRLAMGCIADEGLSRWSGNGVGQIGVPERL
jgi:hypothetical protein